MFRKILTIIVFILILNVLVIVNTHVVKSQDTCDPTDCNCNFLSCLCTGDCSGGGDTPTPPPSGGGGQGGGQGLGSACNAPQNVNCPANTSCVPSGIYYCNTYNINYNSYTQSAPDGAGGNGACTFTLGNAQTSTYSCNAWFCGYTVTTYACCPAGTVSQYYFTRAANYTVSVNPCTGGQPNNCFPDSFVSYVENGYQCGLTPKDENGERFPIYTGTKTCRPAPTKNYVCTTICSVTAPSTPTLLTPSNGASISSTSVSLTWNNSSQTWGNSCTTNNNQYEVYVGSCSGSLALAGTVGSSTNSIQFSGSQGQTYCWKVRAKNGSANTDSAVWSFTINNAEPWWQVKDGDVTTNGDISSEVPTGQLFGIVGLGGFAGVPVYGSSFNLSGDTSKISATLWHANTTTIQSRIFNYAFFDNLIPDDVNFNDVSTLVSGGTPYTDGYEWYTASGDVSTSGDINIGNRKVILFVENGNFNINGKINVNDGVGFFGVFVDGNISIDPAVIGAPSIEGIYLSDGSFSTGLGTSQLHVRGSVASFGGVNLQRDLTVDTTPAELFEFAPDQMLLFPEKLMFRRTKWTEVAP